MSTQRILGLALLVVGIVFLVMGLQATDSVGDTVTEGLTGKYTDKTMWYIVGGLAAAIVGGLLALAGRRRVTT
jgi:drug/metabolite transporter (DMT)-like permease